MPSLTAGKLSRSSDVFSFGIILFELITGKPAVDDDGHVLLRWLQPLLQLKRKKKEKKEKEEKRKEKEEEEEEEAQVPVDLLVDSRVEGQYRREAALLLITVAAFCIGEERKRPTMEKVAKKLHKAMELQGQRR